ncbi:MAG: hypothetical protein GY739_17150, partial [Mesoflavibacter sp.]|nr:hypothetical protein [Mesoflavibacter sp.]
MVETQVKLLTTSDIADFINEYSGLDIRDGKVGDAPFYKYCYYYLSTKYIPLIPYSQLANEINQKHSSVVAGLKTLQDLTDIYKKYRIPLYKIDNE